MGLAPASPVLSLLTFKMQFAPVAQAVTIVVRRGLQCLAGAPWMALPPVVLEEGAVSGFGESAPNLARSERAVLVRVAFVEEAATNNALGVLQRFWDSDDLLLQPSLPHFLRKLFARRWRAALAGFRAEFSAVALEGVAHPQRVVERALREAAFAQRRDALRSTLLRRAKRWCEEDGEALGLLRAWFAAVMSSAPSECKVALLRCCALGFMLGVRPRGFTTQ